MPIAKDLKLSRHRQTEILDSSDLSGLDPEKTPGPVRQSGRVCPS